jgi:hypothetical protein
MIPLAERRPMSRQPRRAGYTFIELVISMGSSVILMAGLCSVLFISTQALTPDATATNENSRSSLAAAQLAADLRLAMKFSERTARAVTFTVPDRDGDGQVEALRYSWTGTPGDPLLYQHNSNTAVTLASNVQQFNLSALTRVIPASTLAPPPTNVTYQSFAEAKSTSSSVNSLVVTKPTGVVAGDLLVAAIVVGNATGATFSPPAGWTLLSTPSNGTTVKLGVWWKIAGGAEPSNYTFTWTTSQRAYGWIMRFTGADASSPINAFATNNAGASSTPTCLAATTTVQNTMVLRIGGFDDDDVSTDNSGIPNYTTITMDLSNTSGGSPVSGGAAYARLPAAGTTGQVNFSLSGAEEFVTFTIAIAPEDGI